MREIVASVFSTSVARGYSLVVMAFTVFITARWLGPSGQGTIAAVTAWATLFGTLGSLSLGQVAIHRATVRRGEQWLGETLGTLLVLAAIITLLCWITAFALYAGSGGHFFHNIERRALFIGFLIVPFVVWELYGSNLLTAVDSIRIYNWAQLLGRTVAVILMLVCWRLHLGVVAALIVSIISQAIVACTGITHLFRRCEFAVRATLRVTRELLHGGMMLHLNAVSSFIFISLGVIIVNQFRGPAETGLYQFATSLVNVMVVVPAAAGMVLSAKVAQLGPDRAWEMQRKILLLLPLVMIALAAVAAVAAPWAVPLVVGTKYMAAIPIFRLLLLSVVGVTFASVMTSQWIGRGYFWQMSVISTVVAGIHLLMSFLLIPRFGMYGAVYATLITQGLAVIGNGALALKCEITYRGILRAATV